MCVCIHKCVCACHRYTSHTIKVPESLTSVPGNSALANSIRFTVKLQQFWNHLYAKTGCYLSV